MNQAVVRLFYANGRIDVVDNVVSLVVHSNGSVDLWDDHEAPFGPPHEAESEVVKIEVL